LPASPMPACITTGGTDSRARRGGDPRRGQGAEHRLDRGCAGEPGAHHLPAQHALPAHRALRRRAGLARREITDVRKEIISKAKRGRQARLC